jgi:hypothetical protein
MKEEQSRRGLRLLLGVSPARKMEAIYLYETPIYFKLTK